MVAYYLHNIADWMDGTGGLTHAQYRVYHVITQLIYFHEGPIANNERGIAGMCGLHVNAYRHAVECLVSLGKIYRDTTDTGVRLGQHRADTELTLIRDSRDRASRGGRQRAINSLKNKEAASANVEMSYTDKIRKEKIREEKKKEAPAALVAVATPHSVLAHVLSEDRAAAVVSHRKTMKAALTVRAAELLAAQFAKCKDPNAAADDMIANHWRGFKAEWLNGGGGKKVNQPKKDEAYYL